MEIYFYIFFLISFLLLLKLKWRFIFFLPLFNLLADMSFAFFAGFSGPTIIRAAINFIFLVYIAKDLRIVKIRNYFYLFFAVILIMLLFSNAFIFSFRVAVQVIMSMSMFLAGYAVFRKAEGFDFLISNLTPIIYLAIIATALGYIFGIGRNLEYSTSSQYNSVAENVGLLGSGGMYAPGIVLGLLPFLLKQQRQTFRKVVLIAASTLLYLLILLNIRRTAIVIPLLGLVGFFIYIPSKTKLKIFQYLLIIALGLILIYPLYSKILTRRYQFRETQGRFQKGFYKTEMRYLETIQMVDAIKNMDEPLKVLFGFGNNLFADQYENGISVRRMIHSDIPKIFYSLGIFGVVFYIIIYLVILREIAAIPATGILRDLKAACFGLFFISILVSINGSVTLFSFRALNFLLLGSFLGYSHKLMFSNGELPVDQKR